MCAGVDHAVLYTYRRRKKYCNTWALRAPYCWGPNWAQITSKKHHILIENMHILSNAKLGHFLPKREVGLCGQWLQYFFCLPDHIMLLQHGWTGGMGMLTADFAKLQILDRMTRICVSHRLTHIWISRRLTPTWVSLEMTPIWLSHGMTHIWVSR